MNGIKNLIRNKEFRNSNKSDGGKVDAQNPWNTSQIKKWLECKPVELEKYRLEKIFYLTRENLKKDLVLTVWIQ